MPIIKSAKKRVRVANKAAIRNSKTKRSLKTAVKALSKMLATKDKNAGAALSKVQSELDHAVKKGVMHKNKAARKKAQAARNAKAAGVSATSSKATKPKATTKTTKASVKKAAPKKVVAKKPTAKK